MRILLLNADYPRFLASLYSRAAGLQNASYACQMEARNRSLFGVADFYSRNFAAEGHVAADIHVNNPWLQSAWARERGVAAEPAAPPGRMASPALPGWMQRTVTPFKPLLRPLARKVGLSPKLDAQAEKILLAQVEEFRPDLVINQDIFHIDTGLARRIKEIGKPILVGQVGIQPPRRGDWRVYDLIISQLRSIVEIFRGHGIRSEVCHLAFEPTLLEELPPIPSKDIDVSFVGTISPEHGKRIELLEAVARRFDLQLFGSPPQFLPEGSPLHRCFQGEVWGSEMYQTLRRSKITLNSHIDFARGEAGNMRLFEATGAGVYLLTDYKDSLPTLFEPGRDVAVWRSIDDCLARIEIALRNDSARADVARSGHARTMANHTYRHRVRQILGFAEQVGR
jgi:hypothetical protein